MVGHIVLRVGRAGPLSLISIGMKEASFSRCFRVTYLLRQFRPELIENIDNGRCGAEVRSLVDPFNREVGKIKVTPIDRLPMIAKQAYQRAFTGLEEMLRDCEP
jgi:hypothetical protein